MILQTGLGKVYAEKKGENTLGEPVYSILSIPYAHGERFEYPKIIKKEEYPKKEIINRKETVCFPQKEYPLILNKFLKHHMMRKEFLPINDLQTEDAFVVNIWTDDIAGEKPVLVFIHGGGEGSGTVPMYAMEHIAEQGIVAVSITYRVGNFGYMPIFDVDETIADLAYHDQQTALRWIYDNIKFFGGDNTNITLMGHCGGAVAALYHFLNPVSNKLFHKLMLCAGNVPMLTDCETAKEAYHKMMARNNFESKIDLKKLSAKKVIKLKKAQNDIVDGKFFLEAPSKLLERAEFPNMPVLIGSNKDEFSMIELPIFYKSLGITKKEHDLKKVLKEKYGEYADILAGEISPDANGVVDLQIQIMELLIFHSSALLLMEKLSKKCSVYGYRLNHVPNLYNGLRGSYHGAELAFFFGNLDKMNIKISEENRKASLEIQKDWIEFIKTGKMKLRPKFNDCGEITEYDSAIRAISFPHEELIHKLKDSGIMEKTRKSYIEKR